MTDELAQQKAALEIELRQLDWWFRHVWVERVRERHPDLLIAAGLSWDIDYRTVDKSHDADIRHRDEMS